MILSPGDSFGAYTILGPLGAGGMGEVYRARDGRLGRDVAIKILPAAVAGEPGRVDRFEVEARAASALNHPNIVVVYEIGTADGPDGHPARFLAMECLDGDPLSARIPRGGFPCASSSPSRPTSRTGSRAPTSPASSTGTSSPRTSTSLRDGRLKILDFGLAKLRREAGDPSPASTTDTLTSPGTVLGTVGYLCARAAEGREATFASDQFSAGCVLYEMLAGRRAFPGAAPAEIASAILRDEPLPLDSVRPGLPPPLVWVVERCLAKLPRDRYGLTSDLARDLRTLKEHSGEVVRSSGSSPRRVPPPRVGRRGLLAAGLVAAGAGLAALLVFLRPAPPVPEFRRLTFRDGNVWKALLEPRATAIVYSASWDSAPPRLFPTAPEVAGMDRPIEAPAFLPFTFDASGARVLGLLGAGRPALNLRERSRGCPPRAGRRARSRNASDGRTRAATSSSRSATRVETRVLEVLDGSGRKGPRPLVHVRRAFLGADLSGRRERRVPPPPLALRERRRGRRRARGRLLARGGHARVRERRGSRLERAHGRSVVHRAGGPGRGRDAVGRSARGPSAHRPPRPRILRPAGGPGRGTARALHGGGTRASLLVRRRGEPLRNLSWLGWSSVRDISPDGRTILFSESGTGAVGSFVRPSDGSGTAVPLGSRRAALLAGRELRGRAGRARPREPAGRRRSGRAGSDEDADGGPGDARRRDLGRAGPRPHAARGRGRGGPVRPAPGRGGPAVDLGPAPCRIPAVTRTGTRVVCIAAPDWRRILVRDLEPGRPAGVSSPCPKAGKVLARVSWSDDGTRLFAVTTGFRLLTLDAARAASSRRRRSRCPPAVTATSGPLSPATLLSPCTRRHASRLLCTWAKA